MICKGICKNEKLYDPSEQGLLHCHNCKYSFKTTERFCPCCGSWLSTKPLTVRLSSELRISQKKPKKVKLSEEDKQLNRVPHESTADCNPNTEGQK